MKKRYKSFFKLLAESEKLFESVMPQAMKNMTEVFKQNDIDFCFIGGTLMPYYGYARRTDDIDILVFVNDKEKFQALTGRYFRKAFTGATKAFYWNNPKVKLEVIYSGEKAGNQSKGLEYLHPKKISVIQNGIPILDLKSLITYKLTAGLYGVGRLKDFGDVQELIKLNHIEREFADSFRKDLKNKYLEIWDMSWE